MKTIGPCLWFDGAAEEAALFYCRTFNNSAVTKTVRFPAGAPQAGAVLTVQFLVDGVEFLALNGGPQYKFTPAVSFVVTCDTQDDVDRYWAALTADGGSEVRCGWLVDKFGVSWQIVPRGLPDLISSPDAAANARAMSAMMQMNKLDLAVMERAFRNE
jgi:predicted 3-demethylubiquinone-9 3-methyltransferase (glyoxalase superfamily)